MSFGTEMLKKRRQDKVEEKMRNKTWTPPGFDISLADAISELNIDHDQIKLIGELTAEGKIANAKVGHNVYYRRATLERLFVDAE